MSQFSNSEYTMSLGFDRETIELIKEQSPRHLSANLLDKGNLKRVVDQKIEYENVKRYLGDDYR